MKKKKYVQKIIIPFISISLILSLSSCIASNKYNTKNSKNLPERRKYYGAKKNKIKNEIDVKNKGKAEEKLKSNSEVMSKNKDNSYLHSDENSSSKSFYAVCSYYGKKFHGKPTASGELFDMYKMTCAHKTLPLGTEIIVTNEENGIQVSLIINDRGPFIEGRDIDLSYAAARKLDIIKYGFKKLKVKIIAFGK